MISLGGAVVVAGSAAFLAGAAVAVPRVFTEPDRGERERLLEEGLLRWRLGQPLYAAGAWVAALGVGVLAADDRSEAAGWLSVACGLLVLGALAWSWSVLQRAVRPRDFARGALPGWPFGTYVWLTIAGLAFLAVGILLGDGPPWLGWLTAAAATLVLAAYVRYRDIPPFVFYLLLLVVGSAAS